MDKLAKELNRHNLKSHLVQRFDRSEELVNQKHADANIHSLQTRQQIQELCSKYIQCTCETNCCYCESGKVGKPLCGTNCSLCVAGQLTIHGKWIGEEAEIKRSLTLWERFKASKGATV